jgi:peroxiredoxin Q/BCP
MLPKECGNNFGAGVSSLHTPCSHPMNSHPTLPFVLTNRFSVNRLTLVLLGILLAFGSSLARASEPPAVGERAPDFTLHTLDGRSIELNQLTGQSGVVLLVLRGWPGYQCPICSRQVHDFVAHAGEFSAKKVQVLMVYPGPAEQLKAHAQEFLADKQWPADFLFVTDPDYTFTNAYGLRWKKAKETAYPSTFVIDREGIVQFAHVSKTHSDRIGATQALAEVK